MTQHHKQSSFCNFRDMHGRLIAVEAKPKTLPHIGGFYRLKDKLYVVGGIAFVNYRLNINLDDPHDSKCSDAPQH